MQDSTITNEQKLPLSLNPTTEAGHAARVDGTPTWALRDGDPGTLEVAADGLSAVYVSPDAVDADPTKNVAQVTVTADADLGQGVKNITDTAEVTIISAEAQSLGLTAGTPVPK